MNQKLIFGLTATLLATTLSLPSLGNTESKTAVDQGSEANPNKASNLAPTPAKPVTGEVIKLGEQKAQSDRQTGDGITQIHSHDLNGRKAATLYVRGIPVLTFVGTEPSQPKDVKLGERVPASVQNSGPSRPKSLTLSSELPLVNLGEAIPTPENSLAETDQLPPDTSDPVWRASEAAAKLNQLYREGVDAEKITVSWETSPNSSSQGRFLIKAGKDIIAVLDTKTVLPDTTRNLEKDALQATNRLRRLLGNATPLREVPGMPGRSRQTIALGPIRFRTNGWASWYGPGFHGNPSASGERFDQNAMTAAHRTLPFGTQVLVTNLDNGQSVVVRINDRGPFHGNRIIDLSTAAARMLGLIQTGVAPVRLELVDAATPQISGN